jgi:hypothetical protein
MFIPAVPKPGESPEKFWYSPGKQGIRWYSRKNQPAGKMLKNGQN